MGSTHSVIRPGATALVTGGARGIGFALASALGAEGLRVALADIDHAEAGRAAASLRERGIHAIGASLDVSNAAQWAVVVAETSATLGPIDLLCNNAGISCGAGPLEDTPPEHWQRVLDVNVLGTVNGLRAVIGRMKERGRGGHVLNVASLAGMFATPFLAAYHASKFAIVGLSDVLRLELEPFEIGVTVLCPGAARTGFFDQSRVQLGSTGGNFGGPSSRLQEHGLPPEVIAARAVEGIRSRAPYVITHAEFRERVEARHRSIMAAFDCAGRITPPAVP